MPMNGETVADAPASIQEHVPKSPVIVPLDDLSTLQTGEDVRADFGRNCLSSTVPQEAVHGSVLVTIILPHFQIIYVYCQMEI